MALYVDLGGAQRADVDVLVSPLAELVATLHVLAEFDHHPEAGDWAEELGSSLPAEFRDRLRLFAPLWARHRCRLFFPLGQRRPLPLPGELDLLAAMDTDQFLLLSASAVLGAR